MTHRFLTAPTNTNIQVLEPHHTTTTITTSTINFFKAIQPIWLILIRIFHRLTSQLLHWMLSFGLSTTSFSYFILQKCLMIIVLKNEMKQPTVNPFISNITNYCLTISQYLISQHLPTSICSGQSMRVNWISGI